MDVTSPRRIKTVGDHCTGRKELGMVGNNNICMYSQPPVPVNHAEYSVLPFLPYQGGRGSILETHVRETDRARSLDEEEKEGEYDKST